MTRRWRLVLQRILPVVVSVGVLAWLFGVTDGPVLRKALNARVAAIMIPAICLFGIVTLGLEAVSIRRLIPAAPAGFGLWTAARIKSASYLAGVVHYTLGIGTLALLLRRRTGMRLGEAASLVILIASVDLLVVLTGAGTAATFIGVEATGLRSGIVTLVLAAFAVGLAALRLPSSLGPFDRLRQLTIFDALRRVPLPRLVELIALRIGFAACFVAGCSSAFVAFQVSAPPALIVGGVLVVTLVATLPIAVAGLGTSQAAFVYLFRGLAPPKTLLAMSLVLSFGILAMRAAMGLVFARELTREALRDVGQPDS